LLFRLGIVPLYPSHSDPRRSSSKGPSRRITRRTLQGKEISFANGGWWRARIRGVRKGPFVLLSFPSAPTLQEPFLQEIHQVDRIVPGIAGRFPPAKAHRCLPPPAGPGCKGRVPPPLLAKFAGFRAETRPSPGRGQNRHLRSRSGRALVFFLS
jgi:hypothetical protein